ncbi:carbohydrate esterase family 16 protein [Sphaerobolus stellatus SS14]|uniref:Carbohydrate esterase family 16 protein n=1 Tax=Sphaerobolus stellatus (strain SS14) TaxID=990650 RepID=A0A0C9W285_SPHS4|nr:carbohydrate esterase family 16 protein [Sphaerobolus stellatus SS14]
MFSSASLITAALAFLTSVRAQQTVYGQCGGTGWTGATTCQSGYTLYYSQCLPGASTTVKPSTTTSNPSTTTSKPSTTTSVASPTSTPGVNYWFSFGDSYTTTGFNVTTGPLPSVGNPLGNPPYPGYTGGGGVNWVDVLTIQYNKTTLLTWNYAYGGATIDASLVTPYEPTVLSLTDQVNSFLNTGAKKPAAAPWTSADTLFSFWIGINDIGNSYGNGGNRSAFSVTLLNAYFNLVQEVYSAGGRNFLFVNVPPMDRSPLMLAEPTSAQALEKSVIADFNTRLAANVNTFQAANSGVKTWLYDSNAAFTTILNSPQTYGFADATSYGNANSFWGRLSP